MTLKTNVDALLRTATEAGDVPGVASAASTPHSFFQSAIPSRSRSSMSSRKLFIKVESN